MTVWKPGRWIVADLAELNPEEGPTELYCLWFDDFYWPERDDHRFDDEWARRWSASEFAALAGLNEVFAKEVDALPTDWPDWGSDPGWLRVRDAARAAVAKLDWGADGRGDSIDEREMCEGKRRPKGMPESWLGSPTTSSSGWRWDDPDKPNDSVRIFRGMPNDPDPMHRKCFVIDVKDGRVCDAYGDPIQDEAVQAATLREHF